MTSTAKTRVLAALRHGPATTAQLCQPDCGGVRFGARIMELRDEGHVILEQRQRPGSSLYTLVVGPAARTRLGDIPSVPDGHDGAGHENFAFQQVYMCERCAYRIVATPRCGCGRRAVRGWYGDFTRPVQRPAVRAA